VLAGGFSVFAGVGERTREGNDLYKEMIESVRTALVFLVSLSIRSLRLAAGLLFVYMRVDLVECLCVACQVHAIEKKIWGLYYLCL
jgi:hypothetical protein